jgi:hypothetical protein
MDLAFPRGGRLAHPAAPHVTPRPIAATTHRRATGSALQTMIHITIESTRTDWITGNHERAGFHGRIAAVRKFMVRWRQSGGE